MGDFKEYLAEQAKTEEKSKLRDLLIIAQTDDSTTARDLLGIMKKVNGMTDKEIARKLHFSISSIANEKGVREQDAVSILVATHNKRIGRGEQ